MWDFLASLFCLFFGTCPADTGCRNMVHGGVGHIVCTYRVEEVSIGLFLRDAKSQPYGSLSSLGTTLSEQGKTPLMLMNGGMYHEDLSPVGLYVEGGEETTRLSTRGGRGNFHLLPNGVFWLVGNRAHITETKRYKARRQPPDFATQSGPMLVIDGKLHPRFLKTSDSLKIRNGVGISRDGKTIHFAISRRPVNFWSFATLFQRELAAQNALFLDGTVSAIQTGSFRQGGWREIGPMIAVFARSGKQSNSSEN